MPDRSAARTVFRAQNEISPALLAHDPAGAERAAEQMRALAIDDPGLRAATNAYADAVIAISGTEGEIAKLDKEVLGTEGRLIGRVTELLRELSARRGRVLSHDFARTLAETKWQSIILGTLGVLIGMFAAIVRGPPHRAAACRHRRLDPRAGGRQARTTSIPDTDVENEIGDIARAAEVFRRTLVGRRQPRARRRCARSPNSAWPKRAIASCSRARSTASM